MLKQVNLSFLLLLIAAWGESIGEVERNGSENEKGKVYEDQDYYHKRLAARRSCDTEQIEYRLTKLEVQVGEKGEHVNSELRETNRRLQALEMQSVEVQTILEGFRNEMVRFSDVSQPQVYDRQINDDKLSRKMDNVIRGTQLIAAVLKGLNADVAWTKNNITALYNTTSILLQMYDSLATKQFVANSMHDIQHQSVASYPQVPENLFREPLNTSSKYIPKHCKEILDNGITESGIYKIQPESSNRAFMVLCDMETRGGGWTFVQNRYDGTQDFFLNWHDYKIGFGNIGGEFWLGLENIYQLTGREVNELLIELEDVNANKAYAYYAAFGIGSSLEGYALKILGGYQGDAGDSLSYHAGNRFSTKDLDQDTWLEGNCAQAHGGAWWYRGCDTSNLNGRYLSGDLPESHTYQGMYWGEFRGPQYSLAKARMLIRPRGHDSPPIFPRGLSGNN